MELNITFTELALFCWAILATAAAIKYKDEATGAKKILTIFLVDEDARNQMVQAHAEFKAHVQKLRGEQ